MSMTVKRLLVEKREEGYEDECTNFLSEVANLYERCLEYSCKWMKPAEFQMDDLERDTKLEECRALPGISDW